MGRKERGGLEFSPKNSLYIPWAVPMLRVNLETWYSTRGIALCNKSGYAASKREGTLGGRLVPSVAVLYLLTVPENSNN